MMRTVLLAVFAAIGALSAVDADLSQASGRSLVIMLADSARAQQAHYELWRRARPQEDAGWNAFIAGHYAQRIVVCPQGADAEPITLVLHGFLSRHLRSGDYEIADQDALFPPEPDMAGRQVDRPAIDAYAADGRQVAPFGGNNVLDERGILADLDGDGWIERVDTTRFGVDGVAHAEAVTIERVRSDAEPLFAAVINWQAEDWSIRVEPPVAGKDALIHAGPTDAAGRVQSRAIVRFDRTSGTWRITEPVPAHIRQIDHRDVWPSLKALVREGLAFPADPPADRAPADGQTVIDGPHLDGRVIAPPAAPWRYQTVGTDPHVVARFMDKGRSIRDLEAEARLVDTVPEAVWTLPPRDAALALAEANRSPAHRQRFRLAIDVRDGRGPPPVLVIDLAVDSSRCYHDTRTVWRLRSGPDGAMLLKAGIAQGGVVFRDPISVLPVYDLRAQPIDPALARHVAGVLWWLDRIRSLDRIGERSRSMMSSTADGRGLLRLSDGDGNEVCERADTLWSGAIAERWRGAYGHEEMLNLANLLLLDGLVPRLGPAWSPEARPDQAGLEATAAEVLAHPHLASRGILQRTVEAAGISVWHRREADLARLAATLDQNLPPLRTRAQIEAEINTLRGDAAASARVSDLYRELFSLEHRQAETAQALTAAIREARSRLAAGSDAVALEAWAVEGRPGWQWALARLHRLDAAAYVRALEARLASSTGHQARAFYTAIAAADPSRATALAAAMPTEGQGPLAVDTFAALQQADAITGVDQRIAALVQVLLDPQQGWEVRGKAIELLVPHAEPRRHPHAAIDEALVAVLAADKADDTVNFTRGRACLALARRGQVAQAGRVIDLLDATPDSYVRRDVLAAAVDLADQAGGAERERLVRWIAAQLERTNLNIDDVLWAAWTLDCRELAPLIEGLATAVADGIEGPMASSYGGKPRRVAEHRYHLARQIAQCWREQDAAARAILLLGLGYHDPQAWEDPARTRRRLVACAAMKDDPAARRAVAAWCAAWSGISHYPAVTTHLAAVTALFGAELSELAK
jgi:hypothetical protein